MGVKEEQSEREKGRGDEGSSRFKISVSWRNGVKCNITSTPINLSKPNGRC